MIDHQWAWSASLTVIDILGFQEVVCEDGVVLGSVCILVCQKAHWWLLIVEAPLIYQECCLVSVLFLDLATVEAISGPRHSLPLTSWNSPCLLSRWDHVVCLLDAVTVERLQVHSSAWCALRTIIIGWSQVTRVLGRTRSMMPRATSHSWARFLSPFQLA